MHAVSEQNNFRENAQTRVKGKKVGLLASVFGCWHKHLSRPFTTANDSYRVCVGCGARRGFNPQTLETRGAFYFPPQPKIKSE